MTVLCPKLSVRTNHLVTYQKRKPSKQPQQLSSHKQNKGFRRAGLSLPAALCIVPVQFLGTKEQSSGGMLSRVKLSQAAGKMLSKGKLYTETTSSIPASLKGCLGGRDPTNDSHHGQTVGCKPSNPLAQAILPHCSFVLEEHANDRHPDELVSAVPTSARSTAALLPTSLSSPAAPGLWATASSSQKMPTKVRISEPKSPFAPGVPGDHPEPAKPPVPYLDPASRKNVSEAIRSNAISREKTSPPTLPSLSEQHRSQIGAPRAA